MRSPGARRRSSTTTASGTRRSSPCSGSSSNSTARPAHRPPIAPPRGRYVMGSPAISPAPERRHVLRELPLGSLTLHPDAGKVPEMSAEQYPAFLADVQARGVLQPLELLPGTQTVLDGRTRLRAATEAGLTTVPVTEAA